MSDLLLKATPALLDGWCGPVVVEIPHHGHAGSIALGADLVPLCWDEVGCCDLPDGYSSAAPHYLALSRAECRDRVARVVFGRVASPRCWRAHRAGRPMGVAFRMTLGDVWYEGGDWWDGGQGHDPARFCPALASLYPSDDTRLPDGSRLVDAQALLAVAREVMS